VQSRTEIRIKGTSTAILAPGGSLCNSCHIAIGPKGKNITHNTTIDNSNNVKCEEGENENEIWVIPLSQDGIKGCLLSYSHGRYYIEVNFWE
jgi:hypothetical protein